MAIIAKKYARKPFFVDAVQVTEENISDVAKWCNGKIVTSESEATYIKVRVFRPAHELQTRAHVGDWVLGAGQGYKVYTQKAFENSFEDPFKPEKPSELLEGVN